MNIIKLLHSPKKKTPREKLSGGVFKKAFTVFSLPCFPLRRRFPESERIPASCPESCYISS